MTKFKFLWTAVFDGKTISQPEDDRYSKHDPSAESNPSAFRDFQDYYDEHKDELREFILSGDGGQGVSIDFTNREKPVAYKIYGDDWPKKFLVTHDDPLDDARVIYYRRCRCDIVGGVAQEPVVEAYVVGYQGRDAKGNNVKVEITVV